MAFLTRCKQPKATGRGSVRSVAEAKELPDARGMPAIRALGEKRRPAAQNLLHSCSALEQVLNGLGGVRSRMVPSRLRRSAEGLGDGRFPRVLAELGLETA